MFYLKGIASYKIFNLGHNIYLVRNDLCIYIDTLVSNVKNVFIPVVSSQSILSDQNMEASILDRNFC